MADIICVQCGEPWDHDELHFAADDTGQTYAEVLAEFRDTGCSALGGQCNQSAGPAARARGALFSALLDIGDVDGAISDFADFAGMEW